MIVSCDKCQARYVLDASRVPPGGGRIPCPACKNIFFVRPPPIEPVATPEPASDTGLATADSSPVPSVSVQMAVRYLAADAYVRDYAQSLSQGSMQLAGATDLEVGGRVKVDVTLPGFGEFKVRGKVSSTDEGGATVTFADADPKFREALSAYLLRLGNRRDAVAYVKDDILRSLIETAGYRVVMTPDFDYIADAIAMHKPKLLVGVVVPAAEAPAYRIALRKLGLADRVVPVGDEDEMHWILGTLDEHLVELPQLDVSEFAEPEVDDLLDFLDDVGKAVTAGDADAEAKIRGFVASTHAFVSRPAARSAPPSRTPDLARSAGGASSMNELIATSRASLSAMAARPPGQERAKDKLQLLLDTSIAAISGMHQARPGPRKPPAPHDQESDAEIDNLLVGFLRESFDAADE